MTIMKYNVITYLISWSLAIYYLKFTHQNILQNIREITNSLKPVLTNQVLQDSKELT